jgi:hypothetical protein
LGRAVIAGAFVAAALWLILLALGTGLGLSSVSPWSNVGASASTINSAAIVWLIIIEIVASAMGGYLAGRLRTRWATIHTDEVYFRDTAHGFLVWAVGLVITASFLASAATSMVGSAGQVRATSFSTAGRAEMVTDLPANSQNLDPNEYLSTRYSVRIIPVQAVMMLQCAQRPHAFLLMPFGKGISRRQTKPIWPNW